MNKSLVGLAIALSVLSVSLFAFANVFTDWVPDEVALAFLVITLVADSAWVRYGYKA